MIRRNILANLAGRAWGVISVYVFVPLYLQFLGINAYGLVGFYATLLGVLVFADMGLTATLNRELARLSAQGGSAAEMRDLIRTYESIYLCVFGLLAAGIWLLAHPIAVHWLKVSHMSYDEVTTAVRLMGIAIALQLPSGLYIGGLIGLQQQVLTNSIQIAWGLVRGAGAVLVLWLLSPTIVAFASWQACANAMYCFAARYSLLHVVSSPKGGTGARFRWDVLRGTWRYAAGMSGIALVSAILTQTDKVVVSKMLTLETFGYYTLAGSLASIPLLLANTIVPALFPRLTALAEVDANSDLRRFYHRSCRLMGVAIIPSALTIALFADTILRVWTNSPITGERAGLAASLLVGGQMIQAILSVPYFLALAHGYIKLNLHVGIGSIILITPVLVVLIARYGIAGAGISWLVMNLCLLPPYMFRLHRRLLPGELRKWIFDDTVRPLAAALPLPLAARFFVPVPGSRLAASGLIALVWILSVACAAVSVQDGRIELVRFARERWAVLHGM